MAGSRRKRQSEERVSPEVLRERRERERRARERRRDGELAAKSTRSRAAAPKPKPETKPARRPAAAPRAAGGTAAAMRPTREGLLGWLSRRIGAIPAALGRMLEGFAREVLAVLAAMLRFLVQLVPGVRWMQRRRAAAGVDGMPSRAEALVSRARTTLRSTRTDAPRRARSPRADAARRARLRRQLQLLLGAALLVSIVAAFILVPRSDAFRIRHLEVSGAAAVTDLQVREQIDPLLAGKTIFTVDERALARAVSSFPFVQDVRVERHLPGGLELHVTEYRPLALALGDGAFWLVARDGRILSRADASEWRGRIPVVTLRSSRIRLGMRVNEEPALQLLAARGSSSTLMFETIEAEDFRLVATLPSGIEVRFGRAVQLREKLLATELVLAEARKAKVTPRYVDVSVPAKPAICDRSVVACGMQRTGREVDEEATAGAATTPEELGGDEAVVEAGVQDERAG